MKEGCSNAVALMPSSCIIFDFFGFLVFVGLGLFSSCCSFSCGRSLGGGCFLCRSRFLWWGRVFGLSWLTTKDITKYMEIHIVILSLGRPVHLVFWWQTIWK